MISARVPDPLEYSGSYGACFVAFRVHERVVGWSWRAGGSQVKGRTVGASRIAQILVPSSTYSYM